MNERHPIDDLFARSLREGEVAPPEAVWERIVQQRSWAHRTLVLLQRRWGKSLSLLLLLGGGAVAFVYWRSAAVPGATSAMAQVGPAIIALPTDQPLNVTVMPDGLAATDRNAEHGSVFAANGMSKAGRSQEVTSSAPVFERSSTPRSDTKKDAPSKERGGRGHVSLGFRAMGNPSSRGDGIEPTTSSSAAMKSSYHEPVREHANEERDNDFAPIGRPSTLVDNPSLSRGVFDDRWAFAHHLTPITTLANTPGAIGNPVSAHPLPPYVQPAGSWFVGLSATAYEEQRMWRGDDEVLINALNSTETPHYPWSMGLVVGREWKGGLALSAGVELITARSSFQHTDRTVHQFMNVSTYLVTLDTQVFVSNVDTLVTQSETRRSISAKNRFDVVRIPVDLSWHWDKRRWILGPRLGLAAELVIIRNGLTLERSPNIDSVGVVSSGVQAVDLSGHLFDDRFSTQLTGSLAFDVGYRLNEYFTAWASPGYARGLVTLSGSTAPYVVPERFGLQVRVTYTFPHCR